MASGADRGQAPAVLTETWRASALVSRADGRILSANPACERLFGYRPGALGGRHLSELSAAPARSPEDRAHTIAHEIAATGVWSGESEGLRTDGVTFPCLISLSEIDGPDQEGRVWVAVFTPT